MTQLPLPLLCLVTDRRVAREPLPRVVARAVEGGVNLVQLREKDLPAGELLRLAEELRSSLAGRALLLVNDRLDVALAVGADGVHLPASGLPTSSARALAGQRLLGRSVHSSQQAARAAREGADYVLLGAIFPTRSHPGQPSSGLDAIRQARPRCPVPLLTIGGITADNAASAVEAGADGVAAISAILDTPDPGEAAARLRHALESAWSLRSSLSPTAGRGQAEGENPQEALCSP